MKTNQIYLKEFEFYDGEAFITFNILGFNEEKNTVEVAITDRGRITVREFDIYEDFNGYYIEYRHMLEKIYFEDFN